VRTSQPHAPYETRYRFTPQVVLAAPAALGFAGWMVWGMAKVLREQPPQPGDTPRDLALYALFLILAGAVVLLLVRVPSGPGCTA
jgi:hypothetical protein